MLRMPSSVAPQTPLILSVPCHPPKQHVSKAIIPTYFKLLQAQEQDKRDAARLELVKALNAFGDQVQGPYW